MANKFLGMTGLGVIVDKIKEVVAALNNKLDNTGVLTLHPTSAEWEASESDVCGRIPQIVRWVGLAINYDFKSDPTAPYVIYTGDKNDVVYVYSGGYSCGLIAIDNEWYIMNGIASIFINPASYKRTGANRITPLYGGPTVKYEDGKLKVFENGTFVDYQVPTGTEVDEITADEVAAKFNS